MRTPPKKSIAKKKFDAIFLRSFLMDRADSSRPPGRSRAVLGGIIDRTSTQDFL
jgi:hypothetical protein